MTTYTQDTESLAWHFRSLSNNFNLIRLLAALAVIYGHSYAVTTHGGADLYLQFVGNKFIGGVAVDVFFLISGFLVTASIQRSRSVLHYAAARVLRIYPALVLCVSLTVLVGWLFTTAEVYWSRETAEFAFYNATAIDTRYFLPGIFKANKDAAINGSLWSITVEVRLYVAVLLIYVLGLLRSRTRFNSAFFSLLVLGYFRPDWIPVFSSHGNHLSVSMYFLIGAFFWVNADLIPLKAPLALAGLITAAAFLHQPQFVYFYTLALSYVVFCVAFAPGMTWFNRLGDYSYGVYLYGWPVQQLLVSMNPDQDATTNTLATCTLALMLAMLSWHGLEKPALRWKRHPVLDTCLDALPWRKTPVEVPD